MVWLYEWNTFKCHPFLDIPLKHVLIGTLSFVLTVAGTFLFLSFMEYEKPISGVPSRSREQVPPLETMIAKAYAETGVPVEYIRGVVAWECGNDLSRNVRNRNGTIDHGPGLNSRWLDEFAWRFNGGRKINPHSLNSVLITARILANNHKALHDWDWTISSYRWGVQGTIMHGIDRYYVENVKRLGAKE